MKHKLIGNKDLYKAVLMVALPIMLQNAITNFVSLLDNLMVGSLGTLQMSAVSISNQLFNVFMLLTFALLNSSGIFLAQYCGKKDGKGMANCFWVKIYSTVIFLILAITTFYIFGDKLVSLYLHNNDASTIVETANYAHNYMRIMLVGLVPFGFACVFSMSLRETGRTFFPMLASIIAVFVNLFFNYCLIFGKLGFPQYGTSGAAIATVIARYCEMLLVFIYLLINKHEIEFIKHLKEGLEIPKLLINRIISKGSPLLVNEIFYTIGITMVAQSYAYRGIDAVAAYNIITTIGNLAFVANMACANAIAIMVGQKLGAGKIEEAKEMNTQITFFSFMVNICVGIILIMFSGRIPHLYNTSLHIRELATQGLIVYGLYCPISSIYLACYFTIRAGGNTKLTFFFDGFFSLFISFPIAFFLSRFTSFGIIPMYAIVSGADILKVCIGLKLISSGKWARNIVD
ncbi:MAG: MATE family efflux transporter [Erysipelotrichaceae bacterium]|nr:MATE family efflux transporter [Erysipelotrichaceae bacterium]